MIQKFKVEELSLVPKFSIYTEKISNRRLQNKISCLIYDINLEMRKSKMINITGIEKRSFIAGMLICCILYSISTIKGEMWQLIEAQETPNEPENDDRTSDESENSKTRQGETPKGAALPP